MVRSAPQQTEELLRLLHDAGFEFAVVGGVAALAHGAATHTKDLDVIAPFSEDNIQKLLDTIAPHRPVHATRPDLSILDDPIERLLGFRMLLIECQLGRLDVLNEMIPIGHYEQVSHVDRELVEGRQIKVITLDQLIEVKSHLNRPKDKIVEMELRAIRETTTSE